MQRVTEATGGEQTPTPNSMEGVLMDAKGCQGVLDIPTPMEEVTETEELDDLCVVEGSSMDPVHRLGVKAADSKQDAWLVTWSKPDEEFMYDACLYKTTTMGKCRSFAYVYRWIEGYKVELEPSMASGWRRTRRCGYDEHVAHREDFNGGHYLGHPYSPWRRYFIESCLEASDFIHDSQFLKFCLNT